MSCQESWQMTNLPEQMKAGVISQKGKTILRLNKIIDKLRSTLIQGFFFVPEMSPWQVTFLPTTQFYLSPT